MRIKNIKDATPEEIRQIQLRELEILKSLKEVLDKHDLPFFIIGGTLIGAIRDKGFVPWDDDIDLMMMREDFETFYAHPEWLEGTNFLLQRSNAKVNQHLTGMTFKDRTTTFINKHSVHESIMHSMFIDIMPLDYRPVGKFKRNLQIFYAMLFSLYNADRMPDHQGKLLRTLSWLPLKLVPGRAAKYKIWSWAQRKMVQLDDPASNEVVELGVGLKSLRRKVPAAYFKETVEIPFEDMTVTAPVGYDKYLRSVFGDYMQAPSKETQKPKHNTYLVDTEMPYNDAIREKILKEIDG